MSIPYQKKIDKISESLGDKVARIRTINPKFVSLRFGKMSRANTINHFKGHETTLRGNMKMYVDKITDKNEENTDQTSENIGLDFKKALRSMATCMIDYAREP